MKRWTRHRRAVERWAGQTMLGPFRCGVVTQRRNSAWATLINGSHRHGPRDRSVAERLAWRTRAPRVCCWSGARRSWRRLAGKAAAQVRGSAYEGTLGRTILGGAGRHEWGCMPTLRIRIAERSDGWHGCQRFAAKLDSAPLATLPAQIALCFKAPYHCACGGRRTYANGAGDLFEAGRELRPRGAHSQVQKAIDFTAGNLARTRQDRFGHRSISPRTQRELRIHALAPSWQPSP